MNILSIVPGGTLTWTNQPAALTELLGTTLHRTKVDMSLPLTVKHPFVSAKSDGGDATLVRPSNWNAAHTTTPVDVRLIVRVQTAGFAGAKLRAQYSTDEAAWNYIDGAAGPSVAIDATGTRVGAWVAVAAGFKADVFVRIIGIDGDGVIDPEFSLVQLQVR